MKKIVLFSDGTGNSSSNPQKTNVWRAYEALDRSPGSNQIAFYDNGVGTSAFTPSAMLGLAFGLGLARNVRQIYGFLCRTYNPGDEIYAFGFSRGAFTIRIAVALIASEGIINRNQVEDDLDLDRLIRAAYRRYRREKFTPSLLSFLLRPVRDLLVNGWHLAWRRQLYDRTKNIRHTDEPGDEALIKFVGVWDTVEAYGLPVDELTRAWDRVIWPLTATNRDLSPRVGRACHALALDEQRESFKPTLWNENGEKFDDERLSQVWFPGVHSNVGGGYPNDALALTALDWVLDESKKNDGLTYFEDSRHRFTAQADVKGPIYNSRSGVGILYRYAPRNLERLCKEKKPGLANWLKERLGLSDVNKNEVDIKKPKIHHSVLDHLTQGGDAYAPINIPKDYAVIDREGRVFDIQNTESPAGSLLETQQEAEERRGRQTFAWNKVWGSTLLYYITLIAIVCFVCYPYLAEPSANGDRSALAGYLEPLLGTFSEPIRAIPNLIGKIPGLGFANSWASKYAEYPFAFSLGIVIIGVLLLTSRKVNAALKAEMRANWFHVTKTGSRPAPSVGVAKQWLAGILDGPAPDRTQELSIAGKIGRALRMGLEALTVLLFVLVILAVCSHLFFTAADGSGGICGPDPQVKHREFGKAFRFDPKKPCFDTGLALKKDKKYAIEFQILDDWADATIEADVTGWRDAPWYMYLFTPLRRHVFAGWYQPIARINDKLFDRYPLTGTTAQADKTKGPQKLRMKLDARTAGRLYLYINDAIVFTPGLIGAFYDNNKGYACVRVTELNGEAPSTNDENELSCPVVANGGFSSPTR